MTETVIRLKSRAALADEPSMTDENLEQAAALIASSHRRICRAMILLGLDEDTFAPLQVYAISGGADQEAAEACWAEIERLMGARGRASTGLRIPSQP